MHPAIGDSVRAEQGPGLFGLHAHAASAVDDGRQARLFVDAGLPVRPAQPRVSEGSTTVQRTEGHDGHASVVHAAL